MRKKNPLHTIYIPMRYRIWSCLCLPSSIVIIKLFSSLKWRGIWKVASIYIFFWSDSAFQDMYQVLKKMTLDGSQGGFLNCGNDLINYFFWTSVKNWRKWRTRALISFARRFPSSSWQLSHHPSIQLWQNINLLAYTRHLV